MPFETIADWYAANRYLTKAILAPLVTMFLALVFLPRLANIASKIGLVDLPSRRKTHTGAKPLVGGIGMAMALACTCLIAVPIINLRGFYAGFVLLVITGFLDDFRELKYGGKFIAQIVAALFMIIFSYTSLKTFGNLVALGDMRFETIAIPVSIFCTVGVINAFNMMDGLDGLAGGISLVCFASFAVLAQINGQPELTLLALAFCGALVAFLYFNWQPASLFMGDAGSLSIGFSLVFFSIAVTQKEGGIISPVTPLLLLAVPICDTIRVMAARMLRGKSPFSADRRHLHHLLIRWGFNRRRTAIIIIFISLLFAVVAVAGALLRLPDYYLFAIFLLYGAVFTLVAVYMRRILSAKIRLRKRIPEEYETLSPFMRVMLVVGTAAKVIRRDRRIVLKVPFTCNIGGDLITGRLADLSITGFSAFMLPELSLGEKGEFAFELPGLPAKLVVNAEVIWKSPAKTGSRYGFRITGISRPEAEMLRLYLDSPKLRTPFSQQA